MQFNYCHLHIYRPSYEYFAFRWGFTIAILPWPLVYIHRHMHPLPATEPFFCFSLGFYHCHFTIALCIDTVSYAFPSALGYTLYLSLTYYFAFRWGFTIAIWPLDFGYLTRPAQESAQYMKVHLYKRQGQASPGQPWPAQARPAQTRPAQPRLGQASPGQPRSGQASPGQPRPG